MYVSSSFHTPGVPQGPQSGSFNQPYMYPVLPSLYTVWFLAPRYMHMPLCTSKLPKPGHEYNSQRTPTILLLIPQSRGYTNILVTSLVPIPTVGGISIYTCSANQSTGRDSLFPKEYLPLPLACPTLTGLLPICHSPAYLPQSIPSLELTCHH